MIFYRAMPLSSSEIRVGDYVTQSKKFAVEHAITSSVYHEEDYGIYIVVLHKYEEANNPGEYLSLENKSARLVGIAKYDDFSADSTYHAIRKLKAWLELNGFDKEASSIG